MEVPFFSIVIPTRNRAKTLEYSIKTILNQTFADFELIISDNSDNDLTNKLLNNICDPRIVYVKTNGQLSMVNNWEYALQFVKGKYVLYIGDDDGLLINALNLSYEFINKNTPEVLFFGWVGYNWSKQLDNGITPNEINMFFYDYSNFIDTKKIIKKIKSGHYYYNELPSIYYSFVSMEFISKIRLSKGRFFNSVSPDIYSGVLICSLSQNVFKINNLIGIRGTSSYSNGAAFSSSLNKSNQIQNDYINLNNKSDINWNDNVPFILHNYSIVMESYFQYCYEFKKRITQYFLFIFYIKFLRRIYIDINDIKKAEENLKIIYNTFKNNNKLNYIHKYFLFLYYKKLIKSNKKRTFRDTISLQTKFGIQNNKLKINGENFNINNIFELQLFLNKLFN